MCDIGLGTELCADARRVLKRLLVRGSRVVRKKFLESEGNETLSCSGRSFTNTVVCNNLVNWVS